MQGVRLESGLRIEGWSAYRGGSVYLKGGGGGGSSRP